MHLIVIIDWIVIIDINETHCNLGPTLKKFDKDSSEFVFLGKDVNNPFYNNEP